MSWKLEFKPERERFIAGNEASPAGVDVRDGSVYVLGSDIELTVNIAIHTGRPLLLCGPPGSGKSSLAAFVARTMGWNYFEQVITSRSEAKELLWSFDTIRRLRDAHRGSEVTDMGYVEPRAVWWAVNPQEALRQADKVREGLSAGSLGPTPPGEVRGFDRPAVLLLDEMDKADPDLPNDILVALGSQQFRVEDTGQLVKRNSKPLVMITTNDERVLPRAFVRRCIMLVLKTPSQAALVQIANAHFPGDAEKSRTLFERVAKRICEIRKGDGESAGPSTAEYLDAVRACLKYGVAPPEDSTDGSLIWQAIESATLMKRSSVD